MNISALTLRDLEYIIAVADHSHFGKAAKAVHVSQPALSGQIKKVEDLLGVKLYERSKRQVFLTPVGSQVVAQARIVMEEARKITGIVKSPAQPLHGTIKLGAIATLGPYYLPHILGPLRKRYPRLNLVIKEGLTDSLLAELKSGALDAVLASPTFHDDQVSMMPLFVEPFLLAAPTAHDLAGKSLLRAADLKASEMVLLEDGHCLRDQTIELCPANRRGHSRQFHATSLETLKHLVATGQGYTLVPYLAAQDDKRLKGLLTYKPFHGKPPLGRQIVLVYRKRYPRIDDINELASFLRENRPDGTFDASA